MAHTILVTGANGFIGSHVTKLLASNGHTVTAFVHQKQEKLNHGAVDKNVTVVVGDITVYDDLLPAVSGMDAVVHCAALPVPLPSVHSPQIYSKVNIKGTLSVLNACVAGNVSRFVFPSTCLVYGAPEVTPTPETVACAPRTPYAVTKQVGELYSRFYQEHYGIETVVLRIFNAYGPRMSHGVIAEFIRRFQSRQPITLEGNGLQERDFIFVDDIARAIECALFCPKKKTGTAYNVGTGVGTSINLLVEKISETFGSGIRVNHTEQKKTTVERLVANTEKTEKELGFSAKIGLDTGLRKTTVSCLTAV